MHEQCPPPNGIPHDEYIIVSDAKYLAVLKLEVSPAMKKSGQARPNKPFADSFLEQSSHSEDISSQNKCIANHVNSQVHPKEIKGAGTGRKRVVGACTKYEGRFIPTDLMHCYLIPGFWSTQTIIMQF